MELDPSIHLEDTVLEDNNMFPICNQALNIPSRQNLLLLGLYGGLHNVRGLGHGECNVNNRVAGSGTDSVGFTGTWYSSKERVIAREQEC